MKLLLDQNLPIALIGDLGDVFPVMSHVRSLGMERGSDNDIWQFAKANGYSIVTKDSDFYYRSQVDRQSPKVIWLRVGNCSRERVALLLRSRHEAIRSFLLESEETCLTLSVPILS